MKIGKLIEEGNSYAVYVDQNTKYSIHKKLRRNSSIYEMVNKIVLFTLNNRNKVATLDLHKDQTVKIDTPQSKKTHENRISPAEQLEMARKEAEEEARIMRDKMKKRNNYNNSKKGRGGKRNKGSKRNDTNSDKRIPTTSKSPYNFIPLSKTIALSQNQNNHNKFEDLSGYIDFDITTKSPLFIRGTAMDDDKKDPQPSYFFGVTKDGGELKIPGSSLRGMIKTVTEILSYSKIQLEESDKYLFYRDRNNPDYRNRVSGNPSYKNLKGGWIIKDNRGKIWLSKALPVLENDPIVGINGTYQNRHFLPDGSNRQISIGSYKQISFDNNPNNVVSIDRSKIPEVRKTNRHGNTTCTILVSAKTGDKKRNYAIGDRNEKAKAKDITKDWKLYCSDSQRAFAQDANKKNNDLAIKLNQDSWIPCFYIQEGNRIFLGDTPIFRLPYNNTIGKYLLPEHKSSSVDIVTSIFGSLESASKISVHDAYPTNLELTSKNRNTPREKIEILASPKPTSYQLYLEQPEAGKLKTYNDDTSIRGHKLYWHRNGTNWKSNSTFSKSDSPPIRPVDANEIFKARIRFNNLKAYELGVLLMAIDLPDGCGHKLGLGKPYGLGSLAISNSKVNIVDRPSRYKNIFSDHASSWHLGAGLSKSLDDYKNNFLNYLKNHGLVFESVDEFWKDKERISHLKKMLTLDQKDNQWIQKTRYMKIIPTQSLNEFENREVLDKPNNI